MPLTIRKSISILLEACAVVLSLLYTLLYLRGDLPLAYFPAFGGALLFAILCYQKKIYAESFLQLFYMGMAVYGYVITTSEWHVETWPFSKHLPFLIAGVVLNFGVGRYLKNNTDAKSPFLDAFTTVFSLIATWFMVNMVHENWIYWIIIDGVSIYLYAKRKLYLGSLLFLLYLFMAIDGYFELEWVNRLTT